MPSLREFGEDVGAVAGKHEAPLKHIVHDSGISESCLRDWLAAVPRGVVDGVRLGVSATEAEHAREPRKRVRMLGYGERGPDEGGGVPVAGEPAGKAINTLVHDLAAACAPLRVPTAVTCRVLGITANCSTAACPRHRVGRGVVAQCRLRCSS